MASMQEEGMGMNVGCSLLGKIALVTGGTQGIGLSIVREFLVAGADVITTGLEKELPESLAGFDSGRLTYVHADFNDEETFQAFLESLRKLTCLDICVNNAGTNRNNPIDCVEEEDVDFLLRCNLRAPLLISREVGRVMKRQGSGRIVNIASIWSVISKAGRVSYSSTKFGVVGLTKAVSADLAPHNVLVNSVSPGFTMTELTRATLSENEIDELQGEVPLGRFADPCEIARLVLFLSSGMNTYISAQNIIIDGGFTSV